MIVSVGKQKYILKFFHEVTGEPLLDKKGKPIHNSGKRFTKCTIREIIGDRIEFISAGYSRCHKEDPFVKEIGRTLSLERALEDACFNTTEKLVFLTAYKCR